MLTRDDPLPTDRDHLTRPERTLPSRAGGRPTTLLLSVDFEDWHQLVRRRIGLAQWEQPGPALHRQTERSLALLDELGIRATFFVLGMAARSHPELIEKIASSGHEIGCHGDAHVLVNRQTRQEFEADLRSARDTIERLTGRRPEGYRAPAFSITRSTPWAYDVLVELGFVYDASQHDSPRIRDRVDDASGAPYPLERSGGTLWEFPVAVWRLRRIRLPVGGPAYWGMMPTALVLKGLDQVGPWAGLYLHPYELDPEPLRLQMPRSASTGQRAQGLLRMAQRNAARRRAADVIQAIAERHRLISYGEAHARLSGSAAPGT